MFINSVRFILQENHHEITANKLPYYSNLRMPSLLMLQLPLYVIYFYIYIYEYIHKTRIPNQFSSEMIHFFFLLFFTCIFGSSPYSFSFVFAIYFEQLFTLWSWLPVRITMYTPVLLYTTEEHGCSLTTFYVRVEQHEPTLMMIKTCNNEVSFWTKKKCFHWNIRYIVITWY